MSIEDLTTTAVRKICPACSREFDGTHLTCSHDGNVLSLVPTDPYIGRRLAEKYLVEKIVGSGGMGTVYQAKHEAMNRRVAIKMMRAQFVQDKMSNQRFELEARALGKLEHQHIISTYDFGKTIHGQPYIVMEFLQGHSLAEKVKELRGLPVERVIDIFDQVCDALDYAHKKGVLHRDLKPGNIMLITGGEAASKITKEKGDYVKVVDFGVAKMLDSSGEESQMLTQQGEVCGSPVYMSPEQCLGQDLDRRADIYSMGVVLYEVLTGKLPLLGKNMMETMGKHIHEAPPPFQQTRPDLYIPDSLERVVMKALSKKPEDRQLTMAQLRTELLGCDPRPKARHENDSNLNLRAKISSVPLPVETEAPPSRSGAIIAVVIAAVVILAGGGIFAFNAMQKPAPAPATAVTPTPAAVVTTPSTPITTPGTKPANSTTPQVPPATKTVPATTKTTTIIKPTQRATARSSAQTRPKPVTVKRSTPKSTTTKINPENFNTLAKGRSYLKN